MVAFIILFHFLKREVGKIVRYRPHIITSSNIHIVHDCSEIYVICIIQLTWQLKIMIQIEIPSVENFKKNCIYTFSSISHSFHFICARSHYSIREPHSHPNNSLNINIYSYHRDRRQAYRTGHPYTIHLWNVSRG